MPIVFNNLTRLLQSVLAPSYKKKQLYKFLLLENIYNCWIGQIIVAYLALGL